ncbi:hypothetical protein [Herbiconiux liukaitaii]|uniref:hypothetical protein n=1 Tax=Herbiconiux liukaitaii TaxID=3342799 RepID=UPI0035B722C3
MSKGTTQLDASHQGLTTVGLFDADPGVLAERAETLSHTPGVDLRITAGSLGQMLTNPAFPTDVVIVQQRAGERVSINYKVRVCRLADARVIVVSSCEESGLASDVGLLMTPVASFDEALALLQA